MFFLEIPHQSPAKAYEATRKEFINFAYEEGMQNDQGDDFEAAMTFFAHDSYSFHAFDDKKEVEHFLKTYKGHQEIYAKIALERLLENG